jgi:hypothetical protein
MSSSKENSLLEAGSWGVWKDLIRRLNSIYYLDESASLSVGDVDPYIPIKNSPDSVFNLVPVFICRWEVQTYLHRTSVP